MPFVKPLEGARNGWIRLAIAFAFGSPCAGDRNGDIPIFHFMKRERLRVVAEALVRPNARQTRKRSQFDAPFRTKKGSAGAGGDARR
jgi:hypothetical protein